jgi:hypothetical protein
VLVPVQAVHRAALAIQEQGDINQTMFEDVYHCKIGLSPDVVNFYYVHFDSEEYASAFILRWL